MSNIYDIIIVGCGVSGAFATLKILQDYPNKKALVLEGGSSPAKRRLQTRAFTGLLAVSDGKILQSDLLNVIAKTSVKQTKAANNFFNKTFSKIETINPYIITKDKSPSSSVRKKFEKNDYTISLNDFIQILPKDSHNLSKYIANEIDNNPNIHLSCNNEVTNIQKSKNIFIVDTENGTYKAKKILLNIGRSGWRQSREIFQKFGLIEQNEIAQFGIRVELPSDSLHSFNNSNCTITKKDELIIGPFSWNGTVIPEDHDDMAITSFRANEERWASDKVSFNLIGNRHFPGNGFEQTDRLAKLTFVMANDRILKEKISTFMNKKSKISIIKEYDWLKNTIEELTSYIPDLQSKGCFYVPTILPLAPKINLTKNLESEVIDGMYISGESSGHTGILYAAATGIIAADSMCK